MAKPSLATAPTRKVSEIGHNATWTQNGRGARSPAHWVARHPKIALGSSSANRPNAAADTMRQRRDRNDTPECRKLEPTSWRRIISSIVRTAPAADE